VRVLFTREERPQYLSLPRSSQSVTLSDLDVTKSLWSSSGPGHGRSLPVSLSVLEAKLKVIQFNRSVTLSDLQKDGRPGPVVAAEKTSAPTQQTSRCVALADAIDRYSRAVFPLAFFAFNVVYWAIYLTISSRPREADFVFFD